MANMNPQQVIGPAAPPIQPPNQGPGMNPPGPSVSPGWHPAPSGGPGWNPAPPPTPGWNPAPPGYRPPPAVQPPGPSAPPGGDPYGSDNWKAGTGPQPSYRPANVGADPNAQLQKSTSPPTVNPNKLAPAPGSTAPPLQPQGGFPDKQSPTEQSRLTRRGGTNFGLREKMAQNGVSGYASPSQSSTAMTG